MEAFEAARRQGLRCVALLGGDSAELREATDIAIVVPSMDPQRVQYAQLVLMHLLCGLIEERLVSDDAAQPSRVPAANSWEHPPHKSQRPVRRLHDRASVANEGRK